MRDAIQRLSRTNPTEEGTVHLPRDYTFSLSGCLRTWLVPQLSTSLWRIERLRGGAQLSAFGTHRGCVPRRKCALQEVSSQEKLGVPTSEDKGRTQDKPAFRGALKPTGRQYRLC